MLGQVLDYALTATVAKVLPGGRFFRLVTADAAVTVEFFDADGQPIGTFTNVLGGLAVHADDFLALFDKRVSAFGKVQLTSATNQTIKAICAKVRVDYDRLTGSVTADVSVGATVTQSSATAGAASGALLAANVNRRRAVIRNTSAIDRVHYSDDGTAATTAHPYFEPGEEKSFYTEDGLNCIRGGGADITLTIYEERD